MRVHAEHARVFKRIPGGRVRDGPSAGRVEPGVAGPRRARGGRAPRRSLGNLARGEAAARFLRGFSRFRPHNPGGRAGRRTGAGVAPAAQNAVVALERRARDRDGALLASREVSAAAEAEGPGDGTPPARPEEPRRVLRPDAVPEPRPGDHLARSFVERPYFDVRLVARQKRVHGDADVQVHAPPANLEHLHGGAEGGRSLAFQHALLYAPSPGLVVPERDARDASHQVVQRGVLQKVLQRVSVRGGDHLHAALRDGACRLRLQLGADLVHDDNLRGVVLHGFDEHVVLRVRSRDLHAARGAYAGVRDVPVPTDLVRGVHDHHAPSHAARFSRDGEHPRDLSNRRRLPDARSPEEQNASTAS